MDTQNVQQMVLKVTENIDQQVDAAIKQIENLNINGFELLPQQHMQKFNLQQGKLQQWLQNGHGTYEQLMEEKMFFDIVKKSDNVVIYFFTPTNTQSPIVDKHFEILAAKHLETRFVSLNTEKCPFLSDRLYITTIPTIICIKNSVFIDKIVGFTQLGNRDDFSTELLEWRLAHSKSIDYSGDLSLPPDQQEKKEKPTKIAVRDGMFNNEINDDLEVDDYSDQFNGKLDFQGNVIKQDQKVFTPEEEMELDLPDEEYDE